MTDTTADAFKRERVDLTYGSGLLELCGGKSESLLLCEGQPIALSWDDCAGSIGQLLRRAGTTESLELALAAFRAAIDAGLDLTRQLEPQVCLLLQMFVNGRYRLSYGQASKGMDVVEYVQSRKEDTGFYPGPDEVWVMTQAETSLDAATVSRHRANLESGRRPPVIVANTERGVDDFVIDGHHKLRAYLDLGIAPHYLAITALDPRPMDDAMIGAILTGSIHRDHYRRWHERR